MKTYVSPIGYNTTSVTRAILSRGVGPDDHVILLRPGGIEDQDQRADEAISDIKTLLSEMQPDAQLSVERVPYDDFTEAVLLCDSLLRSVSDGSDPVDDLIVNFGGGARDIYLPFVVAALANIERIDDAVTYSDIDGKVRTITIPNLGAAISSPAHKTLAVIAEQYDATGKGISAAAIGQEIDAANSTVSRHLSELTDAQAIETWTDGKRKFAQPSLTGRLILQSHDYNDDTNNTDD